MTTSFYFRPYENGQIFYPFHYPYYGYAVSDRRLRTLIAARMQALDDLNIMFFIGGLVLGWISGHWWLAISAYLSVAELIQWWGTRRLLRKLKRVPLTVSLRVYARQLNSEQFQAGILVMPPLIAAFVAFGILHRDPTLLMLGGMGLVWLATLLLMLFWRLKVRVRTARTRIGAAGERPNGRSGELTRH